jgi:5-methylcytosine-specific restriction endonuclease McrA
VRKYSESMKVCSICGNTHYAKGFCRLHYYQQPSYKAYLAGRYQARKEEKKQASKEYYEKNKESCLAANAAWAAVHQEKMRDYRIKWHSNNRVTINIKRMDRYRSDIYVNRAKSREQHRLYSERNPYKGSEWRKANPEAARAIVTNRRARMRSSNGRHSGDEVIALFVKQNGRCTVCKRSLPKSYHKDHIQPLARGGRNSIDNIQLLCPQCNQCKSDRDPIEFMQERGFLL